MLLDYHINWYVAVIHFSSVLSSLKHRRMDQNLHIKTKAEDDGKRIAMQYD